MATFYELSPSPSEHWPIFFYNNILVNEKTISVYSEAIKYLKFFLEYLIAKQVYIIFFSVLRIVFSLYSNFYN